jgi:hypothetical protein
MVERVSVKSIPLTRPKVGMRRGASSEQRCGAIWFYLTVRRMRTTKPLIFMSSVIQEIGRRVDYLGLTKRIKNLQLIFNRLLCMQIL